jgi:hypothetical protein
MIQITKFPLKYNEDDVPLTYKLNTYYYNKSFTLGIFDNKQLIFTCRLYYLNTKIRKELAIPVNIKYELADVFLYPQFCGKTYIESCNGNHTKYSKLCLLLVNNYLKDNNIDGLILWTTNDNIPAITRCTQSGFTLVKNKTTVHYYKNIAAQFNYINKSHVVVYIRFPYSQKVKIQKE